MAARSDRTLRTTCEVVVAQCRALAAAGDRLPLRSRARVLVLVDDLAQALGQPTNARHQNLASLLSHRTAGRAHLQDETTEALRGSTEASLQRLLDARVADLASDLAGQLPNSITNQFGNSHLVDYLRATLLELCVLGTFEDRSLVQPAALRMAARTLSQALGERFPGQTIEVRIPPASAVQLGAFGEGPTHTRGTPPNVVETDEPTWLALGTGLLSLDEALADAQATASGSHYQALTRMLPVIDLSQLP